MRLSAALPLTLLSLALLGGCSTVKKFVPERLSSAAKAPVELIYVPEVVQGNVITREQREQLRPGMTRAEVRDLMGAPLATSLFHDQRWDYAFTLQRRGQPKQSYRLTLVFQNVMLMRAEGDELPSESEFVARIDNSRKPSGKQPILQATPEQLDKLAAQTPSKPAVEPAKPAPAPLPATYPPLEPTPSPNR
jgi:outer membrane protein assembly factor BamE